MTSVIADTSRRRAAVIAGVGYLIVFLLAIFANFFVRTNLIEADDPAATASNIVDSEALFRFGLVAFLVVFIVDVVIAWALYILFKKVNTEVSLLSAWFRLVYTVFLGVALIFFFVALQLLSGADYLDVLDTSQLDTHALVALDAFNYTWLIGLAAFGVHLGVMGYLIVKSGEVTKALGYLFTTYRAESRYPPLTARGGVEPRCGAGGADRRARAAARGTQPRGRGAESGVGVA